MKDIINNLEKSDTCKIWLTIAIISFSYKDTDEKRVMCLKSDTIEIIIYNKANQVIEYLSKSIFKRNQILIKTSMKGSDFIFDYIRLLY